MQSFSFAGKTGYYMDLCYANFSDELIFASIYAYSNQIDRFLKMCRQKQEIEISCWSKKTIKHIDNYYVEKTIDSATDLCHLVLLKKEDIEENKSFEFHLVSRGMPSSATFFDKINSIVGIPLLKQWEEYIVSRLMSSSQITRCSVDYYGADREIGLWRCTSSDFQILSIITSGLERHEILIDENKHSSDLDREIKLDAYLAQSSEHLTSRIQEKFTPRFDPNNDTYSKPILDFEDWCWNDGTGIQLFDAQKSVIAAGVRCLDDEHRLFCVGEMGVGKTKLGAGLTYAHGKQLGYNAIVMAPAHLVRKWAREIEDSVPNAKCVIVSNIADVKALEEEIKNRDKTYNLYMIMSYESAKFKYYEMPCPLWSESKQAYVCPKCGQILSYEKVHGRGRRARREIVNLTHEDFTKPGRYNMVCNNKVEVYNTKTNKKEEVECKEALWRPIAQEEELGDWVKLGKWGWYKTSRVRTLAAFMSAPSRINTLSPDDSNLLVKLNETIDKLDNGDQIKVQALIKYPLGKYIKRMFKKDIDYVVFDEVHKLSSGESLQGQAMGDLAQASRNVIGLTGTLINGYADSLFYILYRMIPRTMQANGYGYDKVQTFLKDYGSAKTTISEDAKKSNKKLPGVSPLLFTEYLLDICAFIALDDVADGLPGYTEIPIGVDLDPDVALAYENIKTAFRENSGFRGRYPKTTTNFMRLLSTYPDMPYDQAPIIDPETNTLVYEPENLPTAIDTKLDATLELVDRKIANGERVLIYYTWTNITNVKDVLETALSARGYNVAVLESNTVKNTKREEWVEARVTEGVDVLICNPRLVETGLDLLDFTTIIFYQLDYSVFTMRQASRRSWRLGQMRDIEVYFMYYHETIQEDVLALMATKLQASMATEGRFSEEGLSAMSQNDDLTTQITNSVIKGISNKVDISSFNTTKKVTNGERLVVASDNRRRLSRESLRYKKPYVARWYKFKKSKPRIAQSSEAIFNLLDQPLVNLFA